MTYKITFIRNATITITDCATINIDETATTFLDNNDKIVFLCRTDDVDQIIRETK